MKLSAQEEYGLRCLLDLARCREGESLTISAISRAEGLSIPNAAKLMRLLRRKGLVHSARGQFGGYRLARPAGEISVACVLEELGGLFFEPAFCTRHAGLQKACIHNRDCALRSLWTGIHATLSRLLQNTTLKDLLCCEREMNRRVERMAGVTLPRSAH